MHVLTIVFSIAAMNMRKFMHVLTIVGEVLRRVHARQEIPSSNPGHRKRAYFA